MTTFEKILIGVGFALALIALWAQGPDPSLPTAEEYSRRLHKRQAQQQMQRQADDEAAKQGIEIESPR